MQLTLTTAPDTSWISDAEAVAQVFGDATADATFLATAKKAAIHGARNYCERAFTHEVWQMTLDKWPKDGVIYLPKGKTVEVTSNQITYLDESNASQTLTKDTHFYLDNTSDDFGRLYPEDSWPDITSERLGAITISWKAGYHATSMAGYEEIKQAVLMGIGELYEQRQSSVKSDFDHISDAYKMLLHPFKIYKDFHTLNG